MRDYFSIYVDFAISAAAAHPKLDPTHVFKGCTALKGCLITLMQFPSTFKVVISFEWFAMAKKGRVVVEMEKCSCHCNVCCYTTLCVN